MSTSSPKQFLKTATGNLPLKKRVAISIRPTLKVPQSEIESVMEKKKGARTKQNSVSSSDDCNEELTLSLGPEITFLTTEKAEISSKCNKVLKVVNTENMEPEDQDILEINPSASAIPSGIFLPGTELLQSPFGKEFSMGSSLDFFFREQSYSSLHSGQSLAWGQVRGDIDDPCGAIANFCGVIADFCGVIAIPEAIDGRAGTDAATPIVARLAKHHKTL